MLPPTMEQSNSAIVDLNQERSEDLPVLRASIPKSKDETMSLFYRNQVQFQTLLKQQNMYLARLSLEKSADDMESRPGGSKKSVKAAS